MKFCPICKKDYNDDEPLCPSCGGTLLNGSYYSIFSEKIIFLPYSTIPTAHLVLFI